MNKPSRKLYIVATCLLIFSVVAISATLIFLMTTEKGKALTRDFNENYISTPEILGEKSVYLPDGLNVNNWHVEYPNKHLYGTHEKEIYEGIPNVPRSIEGHHNSYLGSEIEEHIEESRGRIEEHVRESQERFEKWMEENKDGN